MICLDTNIAIYVINRRMPGIRRARRRCQGKGAVRRAAEMAAN
jgi:hypothetical protein